METYYKFVSLQNIKRFLDIIISERLYAAHYEELNDPMEGAFMTNSNNANIIGSLKSRKNKTRICSLSKDCAHGLMWTHYADGHKGCCIEVSSRSIDKPTEIDYNAEIQVVNGCEDAKELLSHKSKIWEYEKEVRFFRNSKYLKIKIHKIIFGARVSTNDYDFFCKLIKKVNPQINVSKIKLEDIQSWYN